MHKLMGKNIQLQSTSIHFIIMTRTDKASTALFIHVGDNILTTRAHQLLVHCILLARSNVAEGRNRTDFVMTTQIGVERTIDIHKQRIRSELGMSVERRKESKTYTEHLGSSEITGDDVMALEICWSAEEEKNVAIVILLLKHRKVTFGEEQVIFFLGSITCHLRDPLRLVMI